MSNPPLLPISEAKKDGRRILAYGRISWDSYFKSMKPDQQPVWAVVFWHRDETDEDDPELDRSGWYLVNDNPYTDRMDAILFMDVDLSGVTPEALAALGVV